MSNLGSSISSRISSLAASLRRSATNLSDSSFARNAPYASSRLAFSTNHASRLARTATAFTSSLLGDRSSSLQRFMDTLRSRRSDDSLELSREHRDLLSVGAAGTVLSELTSDGRLGTVDNLHGYLNSIADTSPSQRDHQLSDALTDSRPPSYQSDVPSSPPPSYSPLPNVSGRTILGDTDRSIGYQPARSVNPRYSRRLPLPPTPSISELASVPVSSAGPRRSNLGGWTASSRRPSSQTHLARSVFANPSTVQNHPASRYFFSRTPSLRPSTSSMHTWTSAGPYSWNYWLSLSRPNAAPPASDIRSAFELDTTPLRLSRVSFVPQIVTAPTRSAVIDSLAGSSQIKHLKSILKPTGSSSNGDDQSRTPSNASNSDASLSSHTSPVSTPSSSVSSGDQDRFSDLLPSVRSSQSSRASLAPSELPLDILESLTSLVRSSRRGSTGRRGGSRGETVLNSPTDDGSDEGPRNEERKARIEHIDDLISGLQSYKTELLSSLAE